MKSHASWLACALVLTAVLACKYSTNSNSNSNSNSNANSTSAISKITMAKDNGKGDPGDETNTFRPSDRVVHCLATLRTPKEGTRIKFSWWIVDAGGSKNELIKEIDYTTGPDNNVVHGHLSLTRDWPKGKYKCDVYVDDALAKTVEYYVS